MIILGLGSNIGDRLHFIRQAISALRALPVLIIGRLSAVYESDALLLENSPAAWDTPYLNIAAACETSLTVQELLPYLKNIEKMVGREAGRRWGPRVIDIDILADEDRICDEEHCHIPHVGLLERPFALWPLADITPDWHYPVLGAHQGKTAKELAERWGSRFSGRAPLHTRQINASVEFTKFVGVVNVTPDSFSSGGECVSVENCVEKAKKLMAEGTCMIDIGAESTRPGATPLTPEAEWQRIEPVLQAFQQQLTIPYLSLDTRHVDVAKKGLAYGVHCLNDVSGFSDPPMCELAAGNNIDIVVMHNLGIPADKSKVLTLGENPVSIVYQWAEERIATLMAFGIPKHRMIFDIGVGFGKTAEQSLTLLQHIHVFHGLGVRLYVGHSRKSFLNAVTHVPFSDRDIETAITSAYLANRHVHYLRVHNVAISRRACEIGKLFFPKWGMTENAPVA